MKPSGKKKAKKKKKPGQGAQEPVPRGVNLHPPVQEYVRRAEVYRTLAENPNPTPEDVRHANWCKEHGRVARSHSALSYQMGDLAIAGHLPRSVRPAQVPRFDSQVHQSLGPPATGVRSITYGFPPESGVRRYSCREERNWVHSDERAVQLQYMQETQA